jgi:Fe-S cluster biogenesis protein NfuA
MTEQAVVIEHHLEGIRAALAADGYRLSVAAVSPDALSLDIEALDGACADCLVPAKTMEMIVRAAIPDDARFTTVEITYPEGSAAHG